MTCEAIIYKAVCFGADAAGISAFGNHSCGFSDSKISGVSAPQPIYSPCPFFMESLYGLQHLRPLFFTSACFWYVQIIQKHQNQTVFHIPFPMVGMGRHDHRHNYLDIGLDTVSLVCPISAPHLYTAVAVFYSDNQCTLPQAIRTLHDAQSYPLFFCAFSRKRRILVVF